jgi:predicted DNA-binding helix-hairpin-helix protein
MPHSDGFKVLAKQKTKNNIISPMAAVYDYINELNPQRGIKARSETGRAFAPAGQTTQMMVGSMGETDRIITVLADSLYKKYDLRRVYYSPFDASAHGGYRTPKWRGRRLYQADRLVKLYGMSPDEILPENSPNLEFDIDPKAGYALRNIAMFPHRNKHSRLRNAAESSGRRHHQREKNNRGEAIIAVGL